MDAIDKEGKIRRLGEELVKFPLEPTFAKALLSAKSVSRESAKDCCKLVSVLSTESIWSGVSKQDNFR